MKERPILFSGEMVNAILDGRKTQTRRIVKLSKIEGFDSPDIWESAQQAKDGSWIFWSCKNPPEPTHYERGGYICPYGQSGDRLWVRESWASHPFNNGVKPSALLQGSPVYYRANPYIKKADYAWRPSIFMVRWMSRITLEIVSVRVERVQKITREDAKSEGTSPVWKWSPDRDKKYFKRGLLNPYVANFSVLWDEINFKRGFGWEDNPWVWVIEFERVKP